MFVPFKIKVSTAAVALALASGSFCAHAVLERVGPVTNDKAVGFFPSWYQDKTGITLDFCSPSPEEMPGGFCLLLPGDANAPEAFDTNPGQMNFFDEHFYFAATAGMDTTAIDPVTGKAVRALLVLAEEAAFATGAPAAGQQITFSRIRVRLGAAPVAGTYRFIHPYGEEVIVAAAGERIFFTDDVGVACAPGTFDCSLSSRLGPFLLPADAAGNEIGPMTASSPIPDTDVRNFGGVPGVDLIADLVTSYPGTGKAYIADPARIGPVTGGLGKNGRGTFIEGGTGLERNTNIFRIEGPVGSNLGIDANGQFVNWIETTDFSLMGRLRDEVVPGKVNVQRASYARTAEPKGKLDVMAEGFATTQSRTPGQPKLPATRPELSFFNAPCVATTNPVTGAVTYSPPTGALLKGMLSIDQQYWGQVPLALNADPALDVIPSAVCVQDNTGRDIAGNIVPTYTPHPVTDEVTIQSANYDPVAKTLSVQASSSDVRVAPTLTLGYRTFAGAPMAGGTITLAGVEAPPHKVAVTSSAKGSNELDVKTAVTTAPPPPPAPVANPDTFTFAEDALAQTINPRLSTAGAQAGGGVDLNCALDVAAPCTMTIVSQPLHARAILVPTTTQTGAGPTVNYRSAPNYFGQDSFTYTRTR